MRAAAIRPSGFRCDSVELRLGAAIELMVDPASEAAPRVPLPLPAVLRRVDALRASMNGDFPGFDLYWDYVFPARRAEREVR